MGYDTIVYPTCEMSSDYLYNHPELRAKDINDAFADDSVAGIICSIGGYESIRILEYLDTEMILSHPKPIMGFSDSTTFLAYLNQLGIVTYYGPSVMAGFAQLHNDTDNLKNIQSFMQSDWETYTWAVSDKYMNGYKDWHTYAGEYLEVHDNKNGYEAFGNDFSGLLWGGCIEVLEFMKSTKYWPELSFFKDKVIFFETSEEKPTPDQVGYFFRNYAIQGILNEVSGVVIGRCMNYSDDEYESLKKIILDIYRIELNIEPNIVFNAEFGHTDPKWILPLGLDAQFNQNTKTCTISRG
jgi:muramoyltetrapeptide carboxypeptidase LdcA involved in peptidoglycan recycling